MTKTIASVNTASDTFQLFVDKTNLIIAALANEVVTVNSTANGSFSTGNGYIIGNFGSNTIFATTLRGGNLTSSGNLTITTNTSITSNLFLSASILSVGNSTANVIVSQNVISIGAISLSGNVISIGNSTVNTVYTANGILNAPYVSANNRTSVKINNTSVGVRSDLNFIPAGDLTVNIVDNANNNSVDVTLSLSANGIVAGGNTQVQFNDRGAIGASGNLVFDYTTSTLTTNNVVGSTYKFKNSTNTRFDFLTSNVAVANTNTVVDSFFKADYRGGEYLITVRDPTTNTYQISKLLLVHDDTNAFLTEYGTMTSNAYVCLFTSSTNTTHVILSANTISSNNIVKAVRNLIEA